MGKGFNLVSIKDLQNLRKPRVEINRPQKLSINSYHAADLFLYPLKTSENLLISDVFRGFRKRSVT